MRLDSTELLQSELMVWEIGPYHSALPAPMKLKLFLNGEIIATCEAETGFLHRGLEKAFELHRWSAAIAYADHLDPEFAVFGELALCTAVEEIGDISVPIRAQTIRLILCELTRISSHLSYIMRTAKAVGAETMVHFILRDREKILDLFELLTGARFSLNFLRFGGVRADVTEGFIERVLELCEIMRIRMKEYNDLFTFNHSFLKRTFSLATLSVEMAQAFGVTGPNARAAGMNLDLRKMNSQLGYHLIDFDIPVGKGEGGVTGDVHDRFLLRLREIDQSMEILKQILDSVPEGDYINNRASDGHRVPAGEAYSRIESSRGVLGCHVVSDGSEKPARVQFRTPTVPNLMAAPTLLSGVRLEDLPLVLSSLDLGIAEADR